MLPTYSTEDDESAVEGPQSLLLVDHRNPWRSELENWPIATRQRAVTEETVMATFLAAAAIPEAIVGADPVIVVNRQVLVQYAAPMGHVAWDDYNGRLNAYLVRRLLNGLTWSIADKEPASKYTKLVNYLFPYEIQQVSLPDRVLSSNAEAVQYALAIVFGLSELPELPAYTKSGAEAAVVLAIEATLTAKHKGADAKQLFEATWRDLLY